MKKLTINLFALVLALGAITQVFAPTMEEFTNAFVAQGGSAEMAEEAFYWLRAFELVEEKGESFTILASASETLLKECIRASSKTHMGGTLAFDSQRHLKDAFMPILKVSKNDSALSRESSSSLDGLSIVPEEGSASPRLRSQSPRLVGGYFSDSDSDISAGGISGSDSDDSLIRHEVQAENLVSALDSGNEPEGELHAMVLSEPNNPDNLDNLTDRWTSSWVSEHKLLN